MNDAATALVGALGVVTGALLSTWWLTASTRRQAHAMRLSEFLASTQSVILAMGRFAQAPVSEKESVAAELGFGALSDRVNTSLHTILLLEDWRTQRGKVLEQELYEFTSEARKALRRKSLKRQTVVDMALGRHPHDHAPAPGEGPLRVDDGRPGDEASQGGALRSRR